MYENQNAYLQERSTTHTLLSLIQKLYRVLLSVKVAAVVISNFTDFVGKCQQREIEVSLPIIFRCDKVPLIGLHTKGIIRVVTDESMHQYPKVFDIYKQWSDIFLSFWWIIQLRSYMPLIHLQNREHQVKTTLGMLFLAIIFNLPYELIQCGFCL